MTDRVRGHVAHRVQADGSARRRPRWLSVLATVALGGGLAVAVATPSDAVQAPGDDVSGWSTGWSWTYATTFVYNDGAGTNATINETVAYTNAGPTTFQGQSAYQLNLSGTITGGSGQAVASGTTAGLSKFSGTVSGTEYVRRSDLALLQENQHQDLKATASVSILSVGVTASIDLSLTPSPGWKALAFPLNNGDNWQENTDVAYTGGFVYDAGSIGSGSSPFVGSFPVNAHATNATQTINVPINGALSTDAVTAASTDGSTVDNQWWSPGYKNVAKEHLQLPLDGATLTLDRSLSSVSLPTPGTSLTETVTPSLTCAGADVAVAGRLSSGAAGVPLTVTLDESAATAGQHVSVPTTTGVNGNYTATLTAPAATDGLAKNGARAGWGVLVEGGGAVSDATLVVTNQDCTSLSYLGDLSGPVGSSATVSAQLVDQSTGAGVGNQQISFVLSGGSTVTALTGANGVATTTIPLNVPVRGATISASFTATSALTAAATSSPLTIGKDETTTALTASRASVTVGDPVTFTATVTPTLGTGPTGSVQFAVDGNNFGSPVALTDGQATSAALSTLVLGDHTITASYLGDAIFSGSTSPTVSVHVHIPLTPTTTTLDVDAASSAYGQPVTLTATVAPRTGTGQPTGTVVFTDGSTQLGVVAVSPTGEAVLTTADLGVGSHSIVATYAGDDTFDGSASAPLGQNVAKASTTVGVQASDSSTVAGQAVTYSATVSPVAPGAGQPAGTAVLRVDGTPVGDPVPLSGGVVIFPAVTSLGAGTHQASVAYSGSANFAPSTGSTNQDVSQADTTTTLTASPSPSAQDQDVAVTATVSPQAPGTGAPTGTVIFAVDGVDVGAAGVSTTAGLSQATLTTSTLAPGGHSITARYTGDANYVASASDAISQTVIEGTAVVPTTTDLISSDDPSTYGQPITFTATVETSAPGASPDGSVQFAVDGTNVGEPVALDNGVAVSPTLASPEPGDHLVTAAYLPTAAFAASGASLTQTVAVAGVDLVLTSTDGSSDYGQSVHFHATVASRQIGTGKPSGAVQFRVDGVALGSPVAVDNGAADSPAVATLEPGAHTVTALYTGSIDFETESASITQRVDFIATSTTVVSSTNPSVYGQPVTLTATVTPTSTVLGAPSGTVTFTAGSNTLGVVPVAASGNRGTAALTLASPGAGTYQVKASYSGSNTFAASASSILTQTVAKAPTSISAEGAVVQLSPLSLPLGSLRATLRSANGPIAGQPLVFTIGGVTACTVPTDASGVAVCNGLKYLLNLTLALGYKVSYAGDANHLASTASAGLIK